MERRPGRLRGMMQKHAEQDAPYQDADVVSRQHRVDRVIDELQQQGLQDLSNTLRRALRNAVCL